MSNADRQELLSRVQAAISYAPLGVRNAAAIALDDLLGTSKELPSFSMLMLTMQAELDELRPYAHDATYALRGIAGEKRIVAPTYEAEARAFLDTHARVAAKLVPTLPRRT